MKGVRPGVLAIPVLGGQVKLTVTDAFGNTNSATATVTVNGSIPAAAITVVPASTVYTGGVPTNLYLGYGPQSVTLQASAGGTSYAWTGPAGLNSTTSASPVFTATTAGSFAYQVTITNQYGCTNTASVTLKVQDVRCGSNNNKVLVCHHGSQICISADAVATHLLNLYDPLSKCTAGTARRLAASPEAAQPPLFEAFPNPFNESTTLRFRAMATGTVQLRVYNALGQLVLTLYDQETQAGQVHDIVLAGKDLAEGLYTCRLQLNKRLFTQRVMLSR